MRLEEGDILFSQNDISEDMFIIVQGMIELSMCYDNLHAETAVIERLSVGTVINPFNFIAEEVIQLKATAATSHVIVYRINKTTFFNIAQNDKKLLKELLKVLLEDFDE